MKLSKNNKEGYVLSFNGDDTYNWAHRTNCAWPCSALSNKSGFVTVDKNGLCDLSDNLRNEYNLQSNELIAFISDMLRSRNYKHYRQARQFWPIWKQEQ